MKFLAIVLFAFAGVVAAQQAVPEHHEVLDAAAADVVAAFSEGLDELPAPEGTVTEEVEQAKKNLIKQMQDALAKAVEEMKNRIDRGHSKVNDLADKVNELIQRLKAKHAELGDKFKESYNRLKGVAKEHIKDILAKLTGSYVDDMLREKRSIRDVMDVHIQEEKVAEKTCNAFLKMVPSAQKLDVEVLCKKHVKDFVALLNKWLAHGNSRSKRAASDVAQAIKDFFNDIKVQYHEKYADFAEWLKQSYKNALEKATGRHEKLKAVAEEAVKKMHDMKKQTVQEMLDVLRPYKEELGSMWTELTEAAKKVFKKE